MPIRWVRLSDFTGLPHVNAATLQAAISPQGVGGLSLGPTLTRALQGELPVHDPPLAPRDELVFLLHTAAEIEHALLVEYLYAAYSLHSSADIAADDPMKADHGKLVDSWRATIVNIAKEEMGHLMTIQNLLLLVGAPLNFEREAMPFKSEFYPFHFRLEPLTRASLAKYVLAEKPEDPGHEALSEKEEQELRRLARVGSGAAVVNRVGALYASLGALLLSPEIHDDDFLPPSSGVGAFQAPKKVWTQSSDNPPLCILVPPVTNRSDAVNAIKLIAMQGEAGDVAPQEEPSHFQRFLAIYRKFPEAAPQSVSAYWQPTRPAATDPNTLKDPPDDRVVGNITNDRTRDWADLFNSHYRLLLDYLAHYLSVSEPEAKGFFQGTPLPKHTSIFPLMIRLRRLADRLVQFPRTKDGDAARDAAGPPFELPPALALPVREADRWRLHLYVHGRKDRLIDRLKVDASATDAQLLESLRLSDEDRKFMTDRANKPEPPPNGGAGGGAAPGSSGGGKPAPASAVTWPMVKQVLDGAIAAWKAKNGRDPDLQGKHGDSFGWDTKQQLAQADALGYRLIDPGKVGNGQGAQTNLVIALRDDGGVAGNGRMPDGGPYLTKEQIALIVAWIDTGMPD
jgi:Ferritin-like